MNKISLTEFGNPNLKMRKFLLKHTSHFSNELVDVFKFNFSGKHVRTHFASASSASKDDIQTVLHIEEFGHVFFYTAPETIDLLLHQHLNNHAPQNTKKNKKVPLVLTQTHHRLFQKLAMAITNILTADAGHYAVEHTDHPPSDIGVSVTFNFDGCEAVITIMIDSKYVKKLRSLLNNDESFDSDEILNTLRYQPVELGCVLMKGQCSMHEVSQLKPGHFIPLTLCKTLQVKVNGQPTFIGKIQAIDSELGVIIDG
ncbi:FliM/FliN family flagellar motor switch protein [Vibrio sp. ZSDZ65]|uniref:FliM/FliN family flagellar motor switch protein n=1 Tax=Vibrio qingdaonensis TaxID=2829491 RepID=A0A9X3CK30_9VIBR|nr:FliM/FliN family flagellar motor switch protein [Vibrio qingdaonensis]MCW8344634.1 FliM/FliN family flagellar motor switch protein [Vibrio qingdaonensis]